jgi:hypothetical protein
MGRENRTMKGMARRFKRMDDVPWQSEVEVLRCSHLLIFTFFTEVERTSRISRVSFFGGITPNHFPAMSAMESPASTKA